jgi:hypothetical protein
MREDEWSLSTRGRNDIKELISNISNQLKRIIDDLLHIDSSLFNLQLEEDLNALQKLLRELAAAGYSTALAYAEKAKLLADYAAAVRHRMLVLRSRRDISRVRDDMLAHVNDIVKFVEQVKASLKLP